MGEKEDMQRLAEEFGDDDPVVMTQKESEKEEKKIDELKDSKQDKPEKKEMPEEEKRVKLHKIKHHENAHPFNIINGFIFGIKFALGFWLMTLIILGIVYFILLNFNIV